MQVLVTYDVVDDRRRTRLADRLTELLSRVQKSVFQGEVDARGFQELYERIYEETDLSEDSVLVVRLCSACMRGIDYLGTAKQLAPGPDEDEVI